VADAAQSFGTSLDNRRVGTMGDATNTGFFPAKPLGCYGEGGAIFSDDAGLVETLRGHRVHGQGSDKYDNVRIGINGRLDTPQAAILLEKLAIFPDEIEARQRVVDRYQAGLSDIVKTLHLAPGCQPADAPLSRTRYSGSDRRSCAPRREMTPSQNRAP